VVFENVRRPDFSGGSTVDIGNVADRDVRAQLDRILQSRAFRNSERLQRFLKFAVECALEGTVDRLKESLLGRMVFDRGSKYDPRTDSIVRVESQRLRKKLREYYEVEGRADPVSIVFQAGSYVPTFAYLTSVCHRRRQTPGEEPEARLLNRQTVAVVPLSNLSADPDQEYFCDGITDDIIYALSRIPGLNVIGRTSVFALKGAAEDVREVGTRLGAGTIIDGSIRKSGNRLKIFVEILDVASGEVRWAETYARTLDGLFTLEEEIAQASCTGPADDTGLVCIERRDLRRPQYRGIPAVPSGPVCVESHECGRLPDLGRNIRTRYLLVPRIRAAIRGSCGRLFISRLMGT
jgi:TolB-like protein